MKPLFLRLVLTASLFRAQAQVTPPTTPAPKTVGTGQLTGTVRDAAGQPVPYATVVLLNTATRQPFDGTSCDEAGRFALTHIAAGHYTLQVSFMGYRALEQTGLVVSTNGETLALGNLTLQAAPAQLGEVVVQGQHTAVEQRVDRLVYNAELD